ncbi:MAG: putative PEP-binding protein [Cyanobacteria bacterium P01_D01_bin.115]
MSRFASLKTLADPQPCQIGEAGYLLYQLQASGQPIAPSWVITADCFQQSMQKLVTREPIYADWPQLLWQHASATGYSVQNLAKRLRRPLLNLPLALPWSDLLADIDSPVVRLIPSLWCSETVPIAPFAQILESPFCWAEPEALEAAVKQLWTTVLSAKSLAFWSQWATQSTSRGAYPAQVEVAIVVQAVAPTAVSGTLTVRSAGTVAIAAVQGQIAAMSEVCPATYEGKLPLAPQFAWQAGYQEQGYRLGDRDTASPTFLIDACLRRTLLTQPTRAVIDDSLERRLWTLAKWLGTWTERLLQIEWSLTAPSRTLHITQAGWWPLQPFATSTVTSADELLTGHAAAPGQGQGRALILTPETPLPVSAHHQIVIAAEVVPEWLPLLKTAAGIISERGGLTSHAAVLARELGLPAIVGVVDATQRFQPGEGLHIDGDRGLIKSLPELLPDQQPDASPERSALARSVLEGASRTAIWLNLSQPEIAATTAALPVAGVGLLRSEWLMLPVLERLHPYQWIAQGQQDVLLERLLGQLRPILAAFAPRPVRYRSLDIRTSEFAQLMGAPPVEANPMLGIRGTFSYGQQPGFFQLELQLLKRLQDEGYHNVQLLLPFVRTVAEFTDCQAQVQAIGLDQQPDFELWIMAEVPSVLFLLPEYVAAGVQGIAIGTHDLTQLLLGIDRDQQLFSAHFDETHPAVQGAISQLMQSAQQLQIACCLCGASPIHHPEAVRAAIQQGLTAISVDVTALEVTANLIQQAES